LKASFVARLEKGEFTIPVCTKCGKKAWPPSACCPSCFSKTALKKAARTGVLVEFARSNVKGHEGTFGMVRMDGFILVGSFDNVELKKGMKVRMDWCGINDGTPFYHFVPEK
jgi:uncharacterized OB-fold protein